MSKEFIPYEEALTLKELGFDEQVLKSWSEIGTLNYGYLDIYLKAPLYQQAFRWFRVKGYHAGIIPRYDEFHYHIKDFNTDNEYDDVYNISSYEEAELACLRKLIEIVKNKEDE